MYVLTNATKLHYTQHMSSVEHILDTLRNQGFRITKTRKSIISAFVLSKKPLSAPKLEQKLSVFGHRVNKTTIYREIEFLLEQNIIQKVRLDFESDLYELSARPHHHHVICTECGLIEDVKIRQEKAILASVESQTSLSITDHALEFYGLCTQCV